MYAMINRWAESIIIIKLSGKIKEKQNARGGDGTLLSLVISIVQMCFKMGGVVEVL